MARTFIAFDETGRWTMGSSLTNTHMAYLNAGGQKGEATFVELPESTVPGSVQFTQDGDLVWDAQFTLTIPAIPGQHMELADPEGIRMHATTDFGSEPRVIRVK